MFWQIVSGPVQRRGQQTWDSVQSARGEHPCTHEKMSNHVQNSHVGTNKYVVFSVELTVPESSEVSWDAAHTEYTGTLCKRLSQSSL